MCRDLGIQEERILADPKAPRYILLGGKLQQVPMGPGLLASSFMGGGTRRAILRDILGSSESPEPDESVASFVRRKFSGTLLDRLVGLRGPRGEETVDTERLILSVPTDTAGRLLEPLDLGFAAQLSAIAYSGVAVVSLGYRKGDVDDSLAGFGFLVPRSSGLSILGT